MTGAFSDGNTKLIFVKCPKEVLQAREAARTNRCTGSAEASDAYLFPKDGFDLTAYTHALSAAECAERIFQRVFPEIPDDHVSCHIRICRSHAMRQSAVQYGQGIR